jgi:hypothetical protein
LISVDELFQNWRPVKGWLGGFSNIRTTTV